MHLTESLLGITTWKKSSRRYSSEQTKADAVLQLAKQTLLIAVRHYPKPFSDPEKGKYSEVCSFQCAENAPPSQVGETKDPDRQPVCHFINDVANQRGQPALVAFATLPHFVVT